MKIEKCFMQSIKRAGLVKRSNTADCKSAGLCLRRFESYTLHQTRAQHNAGFLFGMGIVILYYEGKSVKRTPSLVRSLV